MELNREQIIKAMQDCIDRPKCIDCPNLTLCSEHGFEYLLVQAISLIKELTEELADCKAIAEGYRKQFEDCAEDRAKLTDENERLQAQFEEVHDIIESNIRAEIADSGTSCKWCENKIKADTVRKMKERLMAETLTIQDHTGKLGSVILVSTIEQIAKEILEGE